MRPLETWEEVGTRVALARESNALTQTALASRAAMERTALAKVESGKRALSSLELARLATVLGRPIQWFVSESPPAVVSRRASLDGPSDDLDVVVDTFARDVELLIELGSLSPAHQVGDIGIPETLREVEDVARTARERTGEPDGPLTNLIAKVEALGLYAASIDLPGHATEGAYVALEGAGVAVINGAQDAGRRRFTLAHELGHHVFADEYATDWALAESRDEREKRINVFAIHFLMPRASITNDWDRHRGSDDPRAAAIRLAVDYRVSWTAACTQLQNLGLIEQAEADGLRAKTPTRADFFELGLFFVPELDPPAISPRFAQAALRAYRAGKIGANRALELLRDTVSEDELPELDAVPLEALRGELDSPR